MKTMVPVPEPKRMEEAVTVPGAAAAEPDAAPMFRVPVDSGPCAIIPTTVLTVAPFEIVIVPLPYAPTNKALTACMLEPLPVTVNNDIFAGSP